MITVVSLLVEMGCVNDRLSSDSCANRQPVTGEKGGVLSFMNEPGRLHSAVNGRERRRAAGGARQKAEPTRGCRVPSAWTRGSRTRAIRNDKAG